MGDQQTSNGRPWRRARALLLAGFMGETLSCSCAWAGPMQERGVGSTPALKPTQRIDLAAFHRSLTPAQMERLHWHAPGTGATFNIIRNPSFESSASLWSRWQGCGSIRCSVSTEAPHSGERCGTVTVCQFGEYKRRPYLNTRVVLGNAYPPAGGKYAYRVQPGARYVVSFWYRGSWPRVNRIGVVGFLAENDKERRDIRLPTSAVRPGAEWRRYVAMVRIPEDVDRIVLAIGYCGYADSEGMEFRRGQVLYLDDVKVFRI